MRELRQIVIIVLALYLGAILSPWYFLALFLLIIP